MTSRFELIAVFEIEWVEDISFVRCVMETFFNSIARLTALNDIKQYRLADFTSVRRVELPKLI